MQVLFHIYKNEPIYEARFTALLLPHVLGGIPFLVQLYIFSPVLEILSLPRSLLVVFDRVLDK